MDLIDRQAAINAISEHLDGVLGQTKYDEGIAYGYEAAHRHIQEVIAHMPSAQPDLQPTCNQLATDTISRQAALKCACADSEIYIAINNLPSAQREQRWIPCGERLPDIKEHHVSEPCIVYCENGAYGFAGLEENIFGQVGWNCERDDEYHEPLGEVIAWMPLPEPYKGRRTE